MKAQQAISSNPLKQLADHGQSVWLDYIRRRMLEDGELQKLIKEDGLRGMTSNPAIFEKAIAGSDDYDTTISSLLAKQDYNAGALFEELAIEDIRRAAELLDPVYKSTNGRDGYVSIEVSPYLAYDTEQTLCEARRLWSRVAKPNIMVKVPATPQGIPAIRQLISEGININITLLFAQEVYSQVLEAYISGLETRAASGKDISKIASVASFFVSRIDSMVDKLVEQKLQNEKDAAKRDQLNNLSGKVAIANARLAYQIYKQSTGSARWKALADKGAQTQRLLWASTGTKNPAFADTLYIDELIGPDTVNTIPPATLDAFRDHGKLGDTLDASVNEAKKVIEALPGLGISLAQITKQLVEDGVVLFADAADKLLSAVEKKREAFLGSKLNTFAYKLPPDLEKKIKDLIEDWRKGWKIQRLWAGDAGLWTNKDESQWLGWLNVCAEELKLLDTFTALTSYVREQKYKHAVLLGMGGSSLGPEVLSKSFGSAENSPKLLVLDSTDPDQIKAVENAIDFASTLFIVSSKSGSTLEPNILKAYFFEQLQKKVENADNHFIAVTDPGSSLEKDAKASKFKQVYYGVPSIGGRYSVLSNFGMIPAAVIGIDLQKFLNAVQTMVCSCAPSVPSTDNRGVLLGLILGGLWQAGKNKITISCSPKISAFGSWLEQLLAESTGKDGKGLIPVDGEPLGKSEVYGSDRVFVYLRYETDADAAQDAAIGALESAGHPVIRIGVRNLYTFAQEFFAWEIAVAVAGSVMGINPFNQPDVEASKVATRHLTEQFEKTGKLPEKESFYSKDGVFAYSAGKHAAALKAAGNDLKSILTAHFKALQAGDYFALLAYIARNDAHSKLLQQIRIETRDVKKVATCVGFGPRFLHSTGQVYKGGPNTGVFLQITADDSCDVAIPGQKSTFGIVKAAQAEGDFEVLAERGRRLLRIHLNPVEPGLALLAKAVKEALESI